MNFTKLDKFMEEMPHRGLPITEVAVSYDGEVVYRKSVGLCDAPKPALYWVFSATKVITCIAAMRLVESGVIALDDKVSKYIPEFEHMNVLGPDRTLSPAKTPMTVEHLFTMTGGMDYELDTPEIEEAAAKSGSTLNIVRAMAKRPLIFEPGSNYKYSLCHDVLAAVVEVASGMKFSDYLKANIFDPLGIVDMGFFPTDEQKARLAPMFKYENGTARSIEIPMNNFATLADEYESGGGGLFASVDEYIKIISVLAIGGTTKDGYKLLSTESIKMMGENRICDVALNRFITTCRFGYGWGLCGRAHCDPVLSMSKTSVGEFGWDGAAAAYALVDPPKKLAIYFGTHMMGCSYAYHVIHPTIANLAVEGVESK